jgi:hypothetical protein
LKNLKVKTKKKHELLHSIFLSKGYTQKAFWSTKYHFARLILNNPRKRRQAAESRARNFLVFFISAPPLALKRFYYGGAIFEKSANSSTAFAKFRSARTQRFKSSFFILVLEKTED